LNFENSSIFEDYVSETSIKGDTTVLGISTINSIIIDSIAPYLRSITNSTIISEEKQKIYKCRPWKLSYDTYNVTDYWYLLLAVNNYVSVYDFKNFKLLYIPDKDTIESVINKELYKNKKIGVNIL
jgi:hypothetical protein